MSKTHSGGMDISAETLYKKSNINAISYEVEEIFKSIKSQILHAHNSGLSGTSFSLPSDFAVGNLEPAEVQLVIYSRLIEKVEKEGLTVTINMDQGTGESSLDISWPSQLDPAEKARMKRIILAHIKRPAK